MFDPKREKTKIIFVRKKENYPDSFSYFSYFFKKFSASFFTSVGTTRGQGIIRVAVVIVVVVVATFLWHSHFWKILKVNKAQILTF